jgi:two-component system chemotaxis response regulator CheB
MTYRLVVVGASFGGFDALKVVLGALPVTFPVPVAIVQHQAAGAGHELASLLQRYTPLRLGEANDKDELLPGRIYLAPAGYHLLVDDEGLALSVDPPVLYARPSIDVLFESAAEVYGPATIGIVLTGTSRDGAAGLARIKQRGGTAIVQDPATAIRRAMPEAALGSTQVDWTLPLDDIGKRLVMLCGQPPVTRSTLDRAAPDRLTPGARGRGSTGPETSLSAPTYSPTSYSPMRT